MGANTHARKSDEPRALFTTKTAPLPNVKLVLVTGPLAEAILERNTLNRSLVAGRVERYARDMLAGTFPYNGETVKMTSSGDLLDGQHRLYAVILAAETKKDIAVPMLFVADIDPSVMSTIDTGKARSFSDVLSIRKTANTTMTAAALRWLHWYGLKPRPTQPKSTNATHTELDSVLRANPDVAEAAHAISGNRAARNMVPSGVLAFVYTLARRNDALHAASWLHLLGSGEGMEGKHPILMLRERMIANRVRTTKLPTIDIAALTAKCWNAYATGDRPRSLRWASTEDFPTIVTGPIPMVSP